MKDNNKFKNLKLMVLEERIFCGGTQNFLVRVRSNIYQQVQVLSTINSTPGNDKLHISNSKNHKKILVC